MGPLLLLLCTSEMFELGENRRCAYSVDFTLLVVVHKPADRAAVVVSLDRDLARIQKRCNHCCMILNLNKTKILVISRSRNVNPSHGKLVVLGLYLS